MPLGLAETTPGPLILVTQFIGHLAGHGKRRHYNGDVPPGLVHTLGHVCPLFHMDFCRRAPD